MEIRIARKEDAVALVEFNQAMALETEHKTLDPDVLTAGVSAVFSDPSKGFYVVVEESSTVAAGLMVTTEWSDWRNGWFWWIQSVYVRPEHRGTGLYEHLAFGIAALVFVILNAVVSHRSGVSWVRRSGWLLLVATTAQVALGGGAWVAKWGFAWTGYVAVADSIQQVALRTAHAVVGMVVFMTAVVHAVRVFRVDSIALECGDSLPLWDILVPNRDGGR